MAANYLLSGELVSDGVSTNVVLDVIGLQWSNKSGMSVLSIHILNTDSVGEDTKVTAIELRVDMESRIHNVLFSKLLRPITAETDYDVVHCPTVGN